MPLLLTIVVFVTVVLVVFAFGAAAVTPSSVLGARLRALGGQSAVVQEPPSVKVRDRIEQALDPLSKAIPLSPSDVSRTRAWLIQAGLRESQHVSYYFRPRQHGPADLRSRLRLLHSSLLPQAHDQGSPAAHPHRSARRSRSHRHLRRGRPRSRPSVDARRTGPPPRPSR